MRNLLIGMLALLLGSNVLAGEQEEAAIRDALAGINSRVPILAIGDAQFPGMYRVTLASGEMLYTNATGSHFIVGELYQVGQNGMLVNLTEEGKKAGRVEQLASLNNEDMIIFPAQGETKAHLTVYTDVDCFYCRKLHKEMDQITAKGIEVRYLAFPRAGAGSKAHKVMESIWCADKDQQNELMSRAKAGQSIPDKSCSGSPVLAQYKMGQEMGVTGTPALIMADGTLVPGYMPAERLAKMLGL